MKKILLTLCMTFLLFISVSVTLFANTVVSYFAYLNVSLGETYETAGVNWQSNVSGTKLVYSEDASFSSPITVTPNEKTWEFKKVKESDDPQKYNDFVSRYICKAQMTNLKENTTYYYKVTLGEDESEVHSFTSASSSQTKTTFGFVTDTQAYGDYYKKANTGIENLLRVHPETSFLLMTGDIVDRGGIENEWVNFFNNTTALKNIAWATVPGNHEYYHSTNPGYISAEIYNQFLNNPSNGPTQRLNSTYFFKYNNILFIMMDTIRTDVDYTETKEWFRKVVNENPSDFIIVGMHSGPYSLGYYSSASKYSYDTFASMFEECGVDLVVSGHEHIFAYTYPMINHKQDEAGVTYLIGGAGGNKSSNPENYNSEQLTWFNNNKDYFEEYIVGNLRTCSISIDGSKLTVELLDNDGNVLTSFTRTGGIEKARKSANQAVSQLSDLKSYHEHYQSEVQKVVSEFESNMKNATSISEINSYKTDSVQKLNLIKEKNSAYQSLLTFNNEDRYYETQLKEIQEILEEALKQIDACKTKEDVEKARLETHSKLGSVDSKTIIRGNINKIKEEVNAYGISLAVQITDENKLNEMMEFIGTELAQFDTLESVEEATQLSEEVKAKFDQFLTQENEPEKQPSKKGCKNGKDVLIYGVFTLLGLFTFSLFGFKKKD